MFLAHSSDDQHREILMGRDDRRRIRDTRLAPFRWICSLEVFESIKSICQIHYGYIRILVHGIILPCTMSLYTI